MSPVTGMALGRVYIYSSGGSFDHVVIINKPLIRSTFFLSLSFVLLLYFVSWVDNTPRG